jgi:hypothetical protein
VRSAMTSEEFRAQYQLGERLTTPPVVTHRAIDESGLPVLVHYLLGSETESASTLLRKVEAIRTAAEEEIRAVTDVDGMPVVVTKVLKEFSTLQDWMSSVQDSVSPPETESEEPGVYTQFFRVSDLAAGTEEPRPPSTPQDADASRLADTPAPTPPPEPGVRREPEGKGAPEREGSPASPLSGPEAEKAPGAYTMIFGKVGGEGEPQAPAPAGGRGSPAAPSPPAPPPHPAEGPGSPAAPPPPRPSPPEGRTAEVTPETSEEKKAPGAYTMLFGGGTQVDSGLSTNAPPPPPPAPGRSGATLEPPPVLPERQPQEQAASEGPSPEPPVHPQAPGPSPSQGSTAPARDSQTGEIPVQPPPEVEAGPPPRPVFPRPGSPPGPAHPPPPTDASPAAPPPPPVAEAAPPPRQEPPGGGDRTGSGGRESDAPGAYTQIFGRAGAGTPSGGEKAGGWGPSTPAQRPPGPPRPPAGQDQGSPEWQRWKDTPGASGRHIPSDDYLQRLGGEGGPGPTSPSSGGPGAGSLTSGPLPPGGPRPPEGPGHYTMVREGLSTDPVPPGPAKPSAKREPPPPAAAPGFAPSSGSRLLPILGLVAILLIIAALVVVFALTS